MLACVAARAFALSRLDKRPALGSDGDTHSSSDVVARAATHRSAPRCESGLVVLSVGCQDFALSRHVTKKMKQ